MGCHGSSTCEINFEDAEGYLIGTSGVITDAGPLFVSVYSDCVVISFLPSSPYDGGGGVCVVASVAARIRMRSWR